MRKLDISQWPGELERQLAALPGAIIAAARSGGETAQMIARGKIAHYQPAVGPYAAWPALAASTIREKTSLGYAPPDNPLLRTGELRDSIELGVETNRLDTVVVLASSDPVMRWQEDGTDKIPPRPVIGPSMLQAQPIFERELSRALVVTMSGDRYAPSTIGFLAFQGGDE